jgi:hypothetical protein
MHMTETDKLDTRQALELAEGVEIRLRMAGPMLRAGAYLIHLLIRIAVLVMVRIAMGFVGIAIGGQVAGGMMLLAWFLMDCVSGGVRDGKTPADSRRTRSRVAGHAHESSFSLLCRSPGQQGIQRRAERLSPLR